MKRSYLACAAAASMALGADAWAEETVALERVTVTGSNIKRIGKEKALAVEVIKKEEIDKTGASTVIQLLDRLPSVGSLLAGTNSSSFAAGAATAGLRGMSSKYVLVLLNGRRLPNYAMFISGTDAFVDLNTLPLSAIESVEILRDGASAIYGSDAVAGVINFKTRRNYRGAEATLRGGGNLDGDGVEQALSLSGGFGDLERDGQNLLLSFDVYHREPVFSRKHDATRSNDYRFQGGPDLRSGAQWGYWNDRTPNADRSNALAKPLPGCPPRRLTTRPSGAKLCVSDVDELGTQLSPRTSRYGLMANYTKRLGGDAEFFAELGVNRSQTPLDGGYSFIQTIVGPGWAVYPRDGGLASVYPDFKPTDNLQITRNLSENGRRLNEVTSDTYRAVAGARTVLQGWDVEGSLNLGLNKAEARQNNVVLSEAFLSMLRNGAAGQPLYDPFSQNNSAAALRPYLTTIANSSSSRLSAFEFKASTDEWFQLPAGAAGFAAGLQWSHESIDSQPDPQLQAGKIMNFAVQQSLQASRSVLSAFGEVNLPVLKNLEVQLALRADHYNDFGDTINPKLAFSFRPWEPAMLRGSVTTGFKAPTLPQLYASRQAYASVYDYAQCADRGIARERCGLASNQLRSGGNAGLKPEDSRNYALGLVLQPSPALSATVDWYRIEVSNTVQSLDPQYVLDNPDRFPGFVVRKAADLPGVRGDIDYISAPYMNIGKTRTTGVDIDLQYDWSLGAYGKLKFRNAQNRIFSYQESQTETDPLLEYADYGAQPRWKNVFEVSYIRGDYSVGLTARSYASYKNLYSQLYDNAGNVKERVASYTALDLNFGLKPIKNLSVSGGIRNLGNRMPSYATGAGFSGGAAAYSGPATDLWGRMLYLSGRYAF
ncbi:TonB-dependent receptor [Chromobacterium alkanivorans]|uniref:TonB-dependent receptor plug domain-containing protein n=1 Tax=Chromobacterium alkanivorans TaxID=1071719 RepID=UPI001966CF7D|nr:TonB-dependent receptor [Chromobacterium alkanivorans]MBN3005252.1 TonB-dependent receptor [Chromobacterium alkanivorans]